MKVDERLDSDQLRKRKRQNILIFAGLAFLLSIVFHFIGIFWLRNLLGMGVIITLINYYLLRPASFYFQARVMPGVEEGCDWIIQKSLFKKMPVMVFLGTRSEEHTSELQSRG